MEPPSVRVAANVEAGPFRTPDAADPFRRDETGLAGDLTAIGMMYLRVTTLTFSRTQTKKKRGPGAAGTRDAEAILPVPRRCGQQFSFPNALRADAE